MSRARQLYRSRNALVGGVCAGIAERFDVDPLVVRILFLTFAVLTLGLAGLAYLVLWAVLPKRPMQVKPVKVEPDSVHSDTFGAVDCRRARGAAMGRCSNTVPYVSAAHLPPVPPAMAEKVRCDQAPAMGLDAASVGPRDAKAGMALRLLGSCLPLSPAVFWHRWAHRLRYRGFCTAWPGGNAGRWP